MQRFFSSSDVQPVQSVSVVIPTYRRGGVLLETLCHLAKADPAPLEVLVVDQTESPEPEIAAGLARLESGGVIRLLKHQPPSIPGAMNRGAQEAAGDVILFLDDDIIPQPDLVAAHLRAYAEFPEAAAVAGRILQPEDADSDDAPEAKPLPRPGRSALRRDFDFPFNGMQSAWVENVIAAHLSVRRDAFLAVGGFDARFIPPVSFRFETEFARRLAASGGRIRFEPRACLRHLRAGSGGTRSQGVHLTSASPVHGVGDYYYAFRWGKGWDRAAYMLRRPFREVRTRFHLSHPWWIPVKFAGELRAMALAFRLARQGPALLVSAEREERP